MKFVFILLIKREKMNNTILYILEKIEIINYLKLIIQIKYYNKLTMNKDLLLFAILAIAAIATWITYEYGIDPSYECSSNKNNKYCKTYKSGGIGKIISYDYNNAPVATYKLDEQTYKCSLHHVKDNNNFPIGAEFNIYYKKGSKSTCVDESYYNSYMKDSAFVRKSNARGFGGIYLFFAYLFVLVGIVKLFDTKFLEDERRQNDYIGNDNDYTNSRNNNNNNTNNNDEERIHGDPVYFEEQVDLEANHSPKIIPTNNKNEVKENVYKIPNEMKTPVDMRIPSPPTSNNVFSVDNKEECYKCLQPITSGNGFTIPPNCKHVVHTDCYNIMVASGYVNCPMCEQKFV